VAGGAGCGDRLEGVEADVQSDGLEADAFFT
jgi:hypothetical protein